MANKIELLGRDADVNKLFVKISSRKSFYVVRGRELDAEQLVNKVKDKGAVIFRLYASVLKFRLEYKENLFSLYYLR